MEAASEKKAADIVLLDARGVCNFADYFVICSGDSGKQLEAVRDEICQVLKKAGVPSHHCEGTTESGWLLVDFSDVIVHIFASLERERYQLDELWSKAALVVRIQ